MKAESLNVKESVLGFTYAIAESALPWMVSPFLLPPPNTGVTSCLPLYQLPRELR